MQIETNLNLNGQNSVGSSGNGGSSSIGSIGSSSSSSASSSSSHNKLLLFGQDLSFLSETNLFMFLSFGTLFSSLGFAYLQERVFLVEDFEYHGFVTLLTLLAYVFAALIERILSKDLLRKAPIIDYLQLSLFTMGGMYFTNWSLTYLNYLILVMFKYSKFIPVMVFGFFIQGRVYSGLEYVSAFLLAGGISIFTLGDASESPKFDVRGLILITIGLFLDAVTSNFEEKRFFRTRNCSQAEVMFYASLFGSIWSFITILYNGELFPAIEHATIHPEVITLTFFFAVLGYVSVIFVLLLIKRFGATTTEIVKSCRKVLSIIISFVVFSKPISKWHVIGGVVFTASVVVAVQVTAKKSSSKKKIPSNPAHDESSAVNEKLIGAA